MIISKKRFYFAFCLYQCGESKNFSKLIGYYLADGLRLFLFNNSPSTCCFTSQTFDNKIHLISDDHFSCLNSLFAEGFLILGNIVLNSKNSLKLIQPEESFR
jgi:hypothetical protein